MTKKKRSVLDRAFTAASYWLSRRGYCGFVETRVDHVAYRCGWYAGYSRAMRDTQQHGAGRDE